MYGVIFRTEPCGDVFRERLVDRCVANVRGSPPPRLDEDAAADENGMPVTDVLVRLDRSCRRDETAPDAPEEAPATSDVVVAAAVGIEGYMSGGIVADPSYLDSGSTKVSGENAAALPNRPSSSDSSSSVT